MLTVILPTKQLVSFLVIILLFITKVNAQQPIIESKFLFGGADGDGAYDIQQTADGGYIMTSLTQASVFPPDPRGVGKGLFDVWVVKLDGNFNIQWQRFYGGSDFEFPAYKSAIRQTNDGSGDYVFVAQTSSDNDGDITGYHGDSDIWVVRIDNDGDIVWQKSLGGDSYEDVTYINLTVDNGFIIAGTTESNNSGDVDANKGFTDIWIIKLDGLGNISWSKTIGGSGTEYPYFIKQTSDGGFLVAGSSHSPNNSGDIQGKTNTDMDCWLFKLNNIGTIQWQKFLGGSNADFADHILETSDGGYIVAGRSESNDGDMGSGNHGGRDIWVAKLDGGRNVIWKKFIGGSGDDFSVSLHETPDGGYLLAGNSNSNNVDVTDNHGDLDYFVTKLNSSIGDIVWKRSFGGSAYDQLFALLRISGNKYILAGQSSAVDGNTAIDGDVAGSINGHQGTDDAWILTISDNTVLPVRLLSFDAMLRQDGAQLFWATATETDNYKFNIQRSINGINFTTIGEVTGSNNTSSTTQYSYLDKSVFSLGKPIIYYRLQQIDNNGSTSYSKISKILINNENHFKVIANRFTGNAFQLQYTSPDNKQVHIDAVNSIGVIIHSQNYQIKKGINSLSVPLSSLAKGVYFIRITGDNGDLYKTISFINQ